MENTSSFFTQRRLFSIAILVVVGPNVHEIEKSDNNASPVAALNIKISLEVHAVDSHGVL